MTCRSWEEAETHLGCLYRRDDQLAERVRHLEKILDTLGSPWWKRVWWRIDGYGPWHRVTPVRRPRPWHRAS